MGSDGKLFGRKFGGVAIMMMMWLFCPMIVYGVHDFILIFVIIFLFWKYIQFILVIYSQASKKTEVIRRRFCHEITKGEIARITILIIVDKICQKHEYAHTCTGISITHQWQLSVIDGKSIRHW